MNNWAAFRQKCVELCEKHRRNYYIKDDLRKESGLIFVYPFKFYNPNPGITFPGINTAVALGVYGVIIEVKKGKLQEGF